MLVLNIRDFMSYISDFCDKTHHDNSIISVGDKSNDKNKVQIKFLSRRSKVLDDKSDFYRFVTYQNLSTLQTCSAT